MKMLVHRQSITDVAAVGLEEVKLHCCVSHPDEDASLEIMRDTAVSDVEQFGSLALLHQAVRVMLFDPSLMDRFFRLPVVPAFDPSTVVVTVDGEAFADFEFFSGNRPMIVWGESFRRCCPARVMVEYLAGFGSTPDAVPGDLRQAVKDQVATMYDGRGPSDGKTLATSPHLARIGARYRGVSVR
ncbi:head-tail connector protein [Cereibacter johrii]|uniref:head-tail connector protein n=1 Tax=Cereibacter johrii TaxID=445629 RepID=UPI003CEF84DB